MTKIKHGVPVLGLVGVCATLFFGQDSLAKPLTMEDCMWLLPYQEEFHRCVALLGADWEENFSEQECDPGQIGPCDGEEEHWVAARFEPSSYPFVAWGISYKLVGNRPDFPGCDSTLEHLVSIYVGGPSPEDEPLVVDTTLVEKDSSATNDRYLELPFSGVELRQGEYLYVSIQNAGDNPQGCSTQGSFTCVATCESGGMGDQTFWSFADAPPFDWQSLASIGIDADVRIGVYGYAY